MVMCYLSVFCFFGFDLLILVLVLNKFKGAALNSLELAKLLKPCSLKPTYTDKWDFSTFIAVKKSFVKTVIKINKRSCFYLVDPSLVLLFINKIFFLLLLIFLFIFIFFLFILIFHERHQAASDALERKRLMQQYYRQNQSLKLIHPDKLESSKFYFFPRAFLFVKKPVSAYQSAFIKKLCIHQKFYPRPRLFPCFLNFRVLVFSSLFFQIFLGIILALHYNPHVNYSFDTVDLLLSDMKFDSWLVYYVQSNILSLFFLMVCFFLNGGFKFGRHFHLGPWFFLCVVSLCLLIIGVAFICLIIPWPFFKFLVLTEAFKRLLDIPVPVINLITLELLWGDSVLLRRLVTTEITVSFSVVVVVFLYLSFLHNARSMALIGYCHKDDYPFRIHPYGAKDLFVLGLHSLIFVGYFSCFVPNCLRNICNYMTDQSPVIVLRFFPDWFFYPWWYVTGGDPKTVLWAFFMSVLLYFAFSITLFKRSRVRIIGSFKPILSFLFWWCFGVSFLFGWVVFFPLPLYPVPMVLLLRWCWAPLFVFFCIYTIFLNHELD